MTYKSYDVVAHALDGELYCSECIEEQKSREEASPVFAGDEFDGNCYCGSCRGEIEVSITYYE